MSRRTATIAALLYTLLCVRLPAWQANAPAAATPPPHAVALGDPAQDWISVRIEWQLSPALRRWIGLLLEREGE